MHISDLTIGEKFFLDRFRRRESMSAASKRLGMAYDSYRNMERGNARKPHGIPTPRLGVLTDGERCRLMRFRDDRLAKEIAADIGVTTYGMRQMEREKVNPRRLMKFWNLVA